MNSPNIQLSHFAIFDLNGVGKESAGTELPSEKTMEMDTGSVEAGLVLIPTTIFFLMVIQLIVAGSWQVLERSNLHDLVIRSNITNEEASFAAQDFGAKPSDSAAGQGDSFGSKNRNLSITAEDTMFGKIKRYELTSSIPVLGDIFAGLAADLFKVKNYAITVT